MNDKHIQAILAVLNEGSITGAARKLFVSQPALSQMIKNAENNLGSPIFNRTTVHSSVHSTRSSVSSFLHFPAPKVARTQIFHQ